MAPVISLRALIRFSKEYRTLIVLFVLAFSVRALYALAVQFLSGEHGFIAFSDAEFFYYRLARNVVDEGVYSLAASAPYYPEAYHTPLYPLFVAAFLLLKLPLLTIALAQAFLGAVMALLSYGIARNISDSYRIAVSAGLLMAFEPMSIFWSGLLMSDTLFAFLFITSVYLLAKRPAMSMLSLGFAALTRPIALYCVPVFLLFIAWQAYRAGRSIRHMGRDIALALAMFAVVVSPWLIRNYVTFGQASLTSASWYVVYVFPLMEFAHDNGLSIPNALPDLPEEEQYRRFSFEYVPQYQRAFFEATKGDLLGFAFVYVRRSLNSLVTDRYEFLVTGVLAEKVPALFTAVPAVMVQTMLLVGQMFWLAVYALALVAVVINRYRPWWLFAAALVGINALLSGGLNPVGTDMSRYSLGLYPLLFLFAGIGARSLWQRSRVWRIVSSQ